MIQTSPREARLFIDGEPVGTTPYHYSSTKIIGSQTKIRLEKEGYETLNTSFARDEEADVGAIIGGVFFLVPFLWTMKYKSTHNYELLRTSSKSSLKNSSEKELVPTGQTKIERLREMNSALEEGIISKSEYEKERKKILDE
ncbi:hypothetical protein AwDysgo_05000 [Bacteroidales bacterium]|nr:hypothetical protein AwDysgo_05000 [Bacteroidales bacterium]